MNIKQPRAETIVSTLLSLIQKHGGPLPLGSYVASIVRQGDIEIRMHPGHRWTFAPSYRDQCQRRLIVDKDWRTIELTIKGKLVFVANLSEEVEIHFFHPGQWEKRFGSNPGDDTVIQQPWENPRAADLKLPPERTGPATGDELRNPTMRQQRSRVSFDRSDGPHSVGLRQQSVPGF